MELQKKVEQFKAIQKKMTAYNHAMGLLYYDSVTTAPAKSAAEYLSSLRFFQLSETVPITTGKL